MMFTNLFFSFLLSQNAHANLISGSEFSNTAETLEKGTFIIRPITPSSYGLTDSIELKLNLWDFELNENMTPWLGVEFQLLESQYLSFSIEPTIIFPQYTTFDETFAGTYLHLSTSPSSKLSFHLDTGFFHHRTWLTTRDDKISFLDTEIRVSSNIQLTPQNLIRFYTRTQSILRLDEERNYYGFQDAWSFGFDWNKIIHKHARLSFGLVANTYDFKANQPGFGDHDIDLFDFFSLNKLNLNVRNQQINIYPTLSFWLSF